MRAPGRRVQRYYPMLGFGSFESVPSCIVPGNDDVHLWGHNIGSQVRIAISGGLFRPSDTE